MKFLITGIAMLLCMAVYSQQSFTIYFDFNKYKLTEAGRLVLDSFLRSAKENLSSFKLNLNGYCDAIGADEYNNELSKQRVAAVKKYFLLKGIEAVNVEDEIGHGKRNPLNENKTAEERQLNRRVEISLIKIGNTNQPGITSPKEKIADSTVTAGTNIVLKNINFIGGMHQLLPESQPMLDELLDAMKTYPKLSIRIEGHICCQQFTGEGMDNETGINNLSEARAKAVQDYLIVNGIAPERLSYKGFGHSSPVYPYPEQSEEERIQNRRVEIKIISK